MQQLTKCDFCRFKTGLNGCMVARNPVYCREAVNEYMQYSRNGGKLLPQKSLRSWDKNRR